jgi:uncharacterized protein with HEPN domain
VSDILDATAKIRERVTASIDAFQGDEMLQVWAIHHLQVIGEAARGVSQSLRERHPKARRRAPHRAVWTQEGMGRAIRKIESC